MNKQISKIRHDLSNLETSVCMGVDIILQNYKNEQLTHAVLSEIKKKVSKAAESLNSQISEMASVENNHN